MIIILSGVLKVSAQSVSVSTTSLEWESTSVASKYFTVYSSSPWQMDTASLSSHFNITPTMGGAGNSSVQVTPMNQNSGSEAIFHQLGIEGQNGGWALVSLTHKSSAGGGSGTGGGGNSVTIQPASLEWSSHDLSSKLVIVSLRNGGIWDADTSYMSSPFTLSAATGLSGDYVYIAPKTVNHSSSDVTDSFFFEARNGTGYSVLNLVQRGVEYSLEVDVAELSWETGDLTSRTVNVSAIGDWSATVSGYGFVVSGASGLDDGTITVQPSSLYYGAGERTAVLTVSCHGISRTVSLRQKRTDQSLGIAGNWILTRDYTKANGNAYCDDITFYNGLGFAEQTVQVGASPAGNKNFVTPVVYDAMMRPDARMYLPYVSNSSTAAEESISGVLSSQSIWYGTRYAGEGQYANAVRVYEASPLNRVLAERKPGKDYATAGKMVGHVYGTNSSNEVLLLSVNGSGNLVASNYYPSGRLYKETITDEDGNSVTTFTDKHGREVLVREGDSGTYFVYDSGGFLSWVISPEGSSHLDVNTTWLRPAFGANGTDAEKYCYIYQNNGLGWPVWRKLPGRSAEVLEYDAAGRVIRSQDGELREAEKWMVYSYDALGREVGRGISNISASQNGIIQNKTVTSQYDNYSGLRQELSFVGPDGFQRVPDLTRVKGLKTYEKVAVLSGNVFTGIAGNVERAFYYDSDGRLCQTVELWPDGWKSYYSVNYDFVGNVTAKEEKHVSPYDETHTLLTTYTYDARGRVLSSSRVLDGTSLSDVQYGYDALGRLQEKNFGSGTECGTESYEYDIHSWMIGKAAGYKGDDVFSEALRYISPVKPGVSPCWNGNLAEVEYAGIEGTNTYGFSHDSHKRLTDALHFAGTATTPTNTMTERSISYDRNGNLCGMKRYDASGTENNITFTHSGNRLSEWQNTQYGYDNNGNMTQDARTGLEIGYNLLNLPREASNANMGQSITYEYLADGTKVSALTGVGDGLKYRGNFVFEVVADEVDSSLYEFPSSVAWDEGRIVYANPFFTGVDSLAFDVMQAPRASVLKGKSMKRRLPSRGTNGVVIEPIDTVAGGEDYIIGDIMDEWYVTDHLGSTRAIVQLNMGGKEEQRFGLDGMTPGTDRVNLNLLDFGARYYDPYTCRWTSPDPLAEKYPGFSPYNYCVNNPLCSIDPSGLSPIYDENGIFLGTDDEGLQGDYIIMLSGLFQQGMTHQNALDNRFIGPLSESVVELISSHFSALSTRPDYDGIVTIQEGIAWAKTHIGAKDYPTPDNTLYVNAALLDFGNIRRDFFKGELESSSLNMFNIINTVESLFNSRLRNTVYALGRFNAVLLDSTSGAVQIVNNEATVYDWNKGGGVIRTNAIKIERKRTGINDSHGFHVKYYGQGHLRNHIVTR